MPDEPVVEKTEPKTEPPTVDKDALEIGELLKAAGYTKESVNSLTESATSLAAIQHLVKNNPQEFLTMLERNDPEAAKKFHDSMAQSYVDRYASKSDPAAAGKDDKTNDLMTEIKLLRDRVTASETDQQKRDQAAAMQIIKGQYEAKVDETIGKLPEEMKLTKSEKAAFKAQLNQRLASDSQIVERCARGNFFDVPKVFKSVLDEWTADRTAAIDAEKKAREASKVTGLNEILGAPYLTLPSEDVAKLTAGDDWEPNIEAFGRALEGAK